MNGWQFREAQVRDPKLSRIPVVVVTAAGPREEIPAISADGWLSKPVDFDRLLATISPFCVVALHHDDGAAAAARNFSLSIADPQAALICRASMP